MGSGTYLFGSTRVLVRLGGYLPGSGLYPFCVLPVLGSGILGARPRVVVGLLPGSVVLPLVPGHCFFPRVCHTSVLLFGCLAAVLPRAGCTGLASAGFRALCRFFRFAPWFSVPSRWVGCRLSLEFFSCLDVLTLGLCSLCWYSGGGGLAGCCVGGFGLSLAVLLPLRWARASLLLRGFSALPCLGVRLSYGGVSV